MEMWHLSSYMSVVESQLCTTAAWHFLIRWVVLWTHDKYTHISLFSSTPCWHSVLCINKKKVWAEPSGYLSYCCSYTLVRIPHVVYEWAGTSHNVVTSPIDLRQTSLFFPLKVWWLAQVIIRPSLKGIKLEVCQSATARLQTWDLSLNLF